MTKFRNKPVYACPDCWLAMKKSEGVRHCEKCCMTFGFYEVFDSKAEHTRGYGELKPLEDAGIIIGLRHHEVFELVPAEYIKIGENGWVKSELGVSETIVKSLKLSGYFKMRPKLKYESDYTYQMKGEKIVEEVKRLDRKIITKTLMDAKTKKEVKQMISIPWPYFADPEAEFKKKCELMLAIHGHQVQVRAGGQLWMFNAKGELERVHGRIK